MAKLLEGKVVAESVIEDLKLRIAKLKEQGVVPGLATILVGDDSASAGYVRKKHEACEAIGIKSFHKHIDKDAKQSDLMATVKEFLSHDAYLAQINSRFHTKDEAIEWVKKFLEEYSKI